MISVSIFIVRRYLLVKNIDVNLMTASKNNALALQEKKDNLYFNLLNLLCCMT